MYDCTKRLGPLVYAQKGPKNGECKDPPTLVFLHGFLGCCTDWVPYFNYFAKTCNCIAFDLPGHGKSGFYELSDYMSLIPKKSHLVGYSMGARFALNLLHSYPNHFNKAILMSAHLGLETEAEKRLRQYEEETWIDRLRADGIKSFIKTWYERPLFKNTPIPSYRYRQCPDLLIMAIRQFSLAKQQNFWNSTSIMNGVGTFIYGEDDPAYRATAERLKTMHANVHILKNCSHAVHIQDVTSCIAHIERSVYCVATNR